MYPRSKQMYTVLKRIYVSKTCSFSGQAPPSFSLAKLSLKWHQTFTHTISKQTQKHQFLTFFIYHAVPTSAFQKPLLNYYNFYSNFYFSDICELYVTNFRFMLATSGFTYFRSWSFLVQHAKFFKLFLLLFMYICMNILKNFEPSRILHREVETLFQKAS